MKLIIAGSRTIKPTTEELTVILDHFDLKPKEVVCGGAEGVDTAGEIWAHRSNVHVEFFHADWDDIDAPGAVIKTNRAGKKYNALAGHWRNQKMADYADALLLIWDGKSTGSADMLRRAKAAKLTIIQVIPPKD